MLKRWCYSQQPVHIRFHVGDGQPLHDDVTDSSLEWLPFGPGCPGEVDASHSHWGIPEGKAAFSDILKDDKQKKDLWHEELCCHTWLHWMRSLREWTSSLEWVCGMIRVSSPSCSLCQTQASPDAEELSPEKSFFNIYIRTSLVFKLIYAVCEWTTFT